MGLVSLSSLQMDEIRRSWLSLCLSHVTSPSFVSHACVLRLPLVSASSSDRATASEDARTCASSCSTCRNHEQDDACGARHTIRSFSCGSTNIRTTHRSHGFFSLGMEDMRNPTSREDKTSFVFHQGKARAWEKRYKSKWMKQTREERKKEIEMKERRDACPGNAMALRCGTRASNTKSNRESSYPTMGFMSFHCFVPTFSFIVFHTSHM